MKDRTLILIGGGGHAKVVVDCAESTGWRIVGFVDDSQSPSLASSGYQHRGQVKELARVLESFGKEQPCMFNAIGANAVRKEVTEASMQQVRLAVEVGNLDSEGVAIVVHHSAVVSPTPTLGCGTLVGPSAVVNASSQVKEWVIINSGAIVEHDCVIGAFAHVAPGAVLGGAVRVGGGTMVGLGARVLPGVQIGERVIVGAGAVVCEDVGDGVTVCGVPARMMR